jgi:hypothetical protein
VLYDVFICHASEDKDSFVRPLAAALRDSHLEVWYDEFSLVVGDSLRESIDKGLSKSRYGIVVLSPAFFSKKWPLRELNGLVAREMSGQNSVILPVWHNITAQQILEYSPPLADRKAVDTKAGLATVCNELLRKLRPDESPLLVARDKLIYHGVNPPVVTDEWWLNVVEASNRIPCWGFAIPEESHWGRWTFPLPNYKSTGEARGVRLAWTAMQMEWEKAADLTPITQITKPDIVLEFIETQPGLDEICHECPAILAEYAPQLTFKGFGGPFENDFDLLLKRSVDEYSKRRDQNSEFGSALTINKLSPACSEAIALRHPTFGDYQSSSIACQFVQGEIGGPEIKFYEVFEYMVWFLSSDANWLPPKTREFLIDGMKNWKVWTNATADTRHDLSGPFLSALWKVKSYEAFKLNTKASISLRDWISHSLEVLRVKDDPDRIMDEFIASGFIECYYRKRKK